MGKKDESGEPEAARSRSGEANRLGDVAEGIGEGLGNLLNQVEGRWSSVRGQRDAVIKNLRAIRDRANALLAEAGDIELPIPGVFKRRKSKGAKGKKTTGSAVPPSVKQGRARTPTRKTALSADARPTAAGSVKSARKGRRGDKGGNGSNAGRGKS